MDNNQQSSETSERSDLVCENGKNSKSIVCQRCGSKVLCAGTAVFAEKEVKYNNEVIDSYNYTRKELPLSATPNVLSYGHALSSHATKKIPPQHLR